MQNDNDKISRLLFKSTEPSTLLISSTKKTLLHRIDLCMPVSWFPIHSLSFILFFFSFRHFFKNSKKSNFFLSQGFDGHQPFFLKKEFLLDDKRKNQK
jgi:predicted permease